MVEKFQDSKDAKDAKDATGLMLDVLMFPECVLYNSVHGIGQKTGATPRGQGATMAYFFATSCVFSRLREPAWNQDNH